MTVETKGRIELKPDEKQIIKEFVDLINKITDELVDGVDYYIIGDGKAEFTVEELNDIYFNVSSILEQFDERY